MKIYQRMPPEYMMHIGDMANLLFSLSLGSILDIIRGEAKLLEGLHSLGIMGTALSKFLRLPVTTVEDSYALDIRHAAIMVRLK